MLNIMKENGRKSFTNVSVFSEIIVADHGICDHDIRKEIRIIV